MTTTTDTIDSQIINPQAVNPDKRGTGSVIVTQTLALLYDAYRQVNANKLFWVTLGLSILVAAAFGAVGFEKNRVTLPFFGALGPPTGFKDARAFYGYIFVTFGVGIWLTWAQIILAIISTASIFPDLISGGSVDLYLSKPVSRLRLFVTKYVFGLLFVALQAAAFAGACFFVIGFRGGAWLPGIFLAVPIVTLYFSFLFCVLVLIGVVTRSTLASILLTILLWFILFLINTTETSLLLFQTLGQTEMRVNQQIIDRNADRLAEWEAHPDKAPGEVMIETTRLGQQAIRQHMDESQSTLDNLVIAHRIAYAAKWPLPKTSETAALMRRWIVGSVDFNDEPAPPEYDEPIDADQPGINLAPDDFRVQNKFQSEIDSRSAVWVIGTSLGFEVVVVLLATWVFARRDY